MDKDNSLYLVIFIFIIIIILLIIWLITKDNCSGTCSALNSNDNSSNSFKNTKLNISNGIRTKLNQASLNWAGYVAVNNIGFPLDGQAHCVSGSFIIPSVGIKDIKDIRNSSSDSNPKLSIWVGIDGAFDSCPTIQQMGVDISNNYGILKMKAWYRAYDDPYSLNKTYLDDFPIDVNDEISIVVRLNRLGLQENRNRKQSSNIFLFQIENKTKEVKSIFDATAIGYKCHSVEWIVESTNFNFEPIVFKNCSASIGDGYKMPISYYDELRLNMVEELHPHTIKIQTSNLSEDDKGSSFIVTSLV